MRNINVDTTANKICIKDLQFIIYKTEECTIIIYIILKIKIFNYIKSFG